MEDLNVLPPQITHKLYRNFPYNSSDEFYVNVGEWIGSEWSTYRERKPTPLEIISGRHLRIAAPSVSFVEILPLLYVISIFQTASALHTILSNTER